MITTHEMRRLCAEVAAFSRSADWKFQAMPVVAWEFLTIDAFAKAKRSVLYAVGPLMRYEPRESWHRAVSPEVYEIDCEGVTFRLTCRQRMMTPAGAVGAAEIAFRGHKE